MAKVRRWREVPRQDAAEIAGGAGQQHGFGRGLWHGRFLRRAQSAIAGPPG